MDTVCGVCINGTYSDGTFTACKPHTKCQSMGHKQINAGTVSSDARCEYFTPALIGIITGVVVIVLVIIGVSTQYIIFKLKSNTRPGISELTGMLIGKVCRSARKHNIQEIPYIGAIFF